MDRAQLQNRSLRQRLAHVLVDHAGAHHADFGGGASPPGSASSRPTTRQAPGCALPPPGAGRRGHGGHHHVLRRVLLVGPDFGFLPLLQGGHRARVGDGGGGCEGGTGCRTVRSAGTPPSRRRGTPHCRRVPASESAPRGRTSGCPVRSGRSSCRGRRPRRSRGRRKRPV